MSKEDQVAFLMSRNKSDPYPLTPIPDQEVAENKILVGTEERN
jgi:hypothetical protein